MIELALTARFYFGDRQKVLEKLDLAVDESEGRYWFRFHQVAKMYLEVKFSKAVVEKEVHRNFERIYANEDNQLTRTDTKSGEVPRLALLKSMLKRWQEKSKK